MRRFVLMLGVWGLAACATEAPGNDEAPGSDDPAQPDVSEEVAYSFAYTPMGFARVAMDPSGTAILASSFNSALGGTAAVTPSGSGGSYAVTFNDLGTTSFAGGARGNVQITAEGTSNVRCRITNWGGAPNLVVSLQCNAPDGSLAATPFAVGFYRKAMPAPTGFPASNAYAWVTAAGVPSMMYNYNNSGVANTVVATPPGNYQINISNATFINSSMMVTPYGGALAGNVCSIVNWGAGFANVECRDRLGALVDSAFSFSYSTSGPAPSQQGGHAWFDGTAAHWMYSRADGKISVCSPASVSGSGVGSLATVVVAGDLGPWDASPFVRASFVNSYGTAGYCKVESLTAAGAPPMSVGTTTVRCYTATGAVVAVPRFTFTHETSDASGPC
jgi:hypothetical protein